MIFLTESQNNQDQNNQNNQPPSGCQRIFLPFQPVGLKPTGFFYGGIRFEKFKRKIKRKQLQKNKLKLVFNIAKINKELKELDRLDREEKETKNLQYNGYYI